MISDKIEGILRDMDLTSYPVQVLVRGDSPLWVLNAYLSLNSRGKFHFIEEPNNRMTMRTLFMNFTSGVPQVRDIPERILYGRWNLFGFE